VPTGGLFRFVALAGVILCGSLCRPAEAQQSDSGDGSSYGSSLNGPTLGYIFDGSSVEIRPVFGIPGASILGDPVPLGSSVATAEISAAQDFALVTSGLDGTPSVIPLNVASGEVTAIPGALAAPSRVVLSPGGASAALYYAQQQTIQVVTGLPSSPAISRQIDLSQFASTLSALAITDDATFVMAGFSAPEGGSVYLMASDGSQQLVLTLGTPSAILFLDSNPDALVADQSNDTVYLLQNNGGNLAATVAANHDSGVVAPEALGVTGDGRWAFISSAEGEQITGIDLSGASVPVPISCPCNPSSLQRMRGGAVFRLTEASSGSIWLLDATADQPRVVFVAQPLAQAEATLPRIDENGESQ
jgi:hypothetical protein